MDSRLQRMRRRRGYAPVPTDGAADELPLEFTHDFLLTQIDHDRSAESGDTDSSDRSRRSRFDLQALREGRPDTSVYQKYLTARVGHPVSDVAARRVKQEMLCRHLGDDAELMAIVKRNDFLLKTRTGKTFETVKEIASALTRARENPDDPNEWKHMSDLMVLFRRVGIDVENSDVRKYLADYHRANPDTEETPPAKYKLLDRFVNPPGKVKKPPKSGHVVRKQHKTYPLAKRKNPKTVHLKQNEHRQAEYESAMAQLYGFLGDVEMAPKARVVVDKARVAVDEYGLAYGSYSVTVPLRDISKFHFWELWPTRLLAKTKIARVLTIKWLMAEDDFHQFNLDPNYLFDHDMSCWPVAVRYKGNVRGVEPEFDVTERDIRDFPNLHDAKPTYWPTPPLESATKRGPNPITGYKTSPRGRFVIAPKIKKLGQYAAFQAEKNYCIVKMTLLPDGKSL